MTSNIHLDEKRGLLEEAWKLPPPAMSLTFNQDLQKLSQEHLFAYLGALRQTRLLFAVSADAEGVGNHAVMAACTKIKHAGALTAQEAEMVAHAKALVEQRKASEALLKRLQDNLNTATAKLHGLLALEDKVRNRPSV